MCESEAWGPDIFGHGQQSDRASGFQHFGAGVVGVGAWDAGEIQRDGSLIGGEFCPAGVPGQFVFFQAGRPPDLLADAGIQNPYRLGDALGVDLPGGQLLLPAVGEITGGAFRGRRHQQRLHRRPGFLGVRAHGVEYLAGEGGHGLDQAANEGEFRLPVRRERSRPHRRAEQHQRARVTAGGETSPRVQVSPHLLPLLAGCAHATRLGLLKVRAPAADPGGIISPPGGSVLGRYAQVHGVPPPAGLLPTTVSIATESATRAVFDRRCYYAAAGQRLTIRFANSMTVLSRHGISLTLLISPSHDPAISSVPGKPGMGIVDQSKAVFAGQPVTAPETGVMSVPPLEAGVYVLQVREMPTTFRATLVVQ